jgi:protease I
MTPPLENARVLTFVGDDYEDMELQYPKYRLREAGAEVVVAGVEAGVKHKGKHGYPQLAEADDALVVPGGWMPDKLRRYDAVKSVTRAMAEAHKPVASICHGPWIDISAGIVAGVTYTSTPGIKDDLENAGATWVDEVVHVDEVHRRVSSRRPDDLPAFCAELIAMMLRVREGAAA